MMGTSFNIVAVEESSIAGNSTNPEVVPMSIEEEDPGDGTSDTDKETPLQTADRGLWISLLRSAIDEYPQHQIQEAFQYFGPGIFEFLLKCYAPQSGDRRTFAVNLLNHIITYVYQGSKNVTIGQQFNQNKFNYTMPFDEFIGQPEAIVQVVKQREVAVAKQVEMVLVSLGGLFLDDEGWHVGEDLNEEVAEVEGDGVDDGAEVAMEVNSIEPGSRTLTLLEAIRDCPENRVLVKLQHTGAGTMDDPYVCRYMSWEEYHANFSRRGRPQDLDAQQKIINAEYHNTENKIIPVNHPDAVQNPTTGIWRDRRNPDSTPKDLYDYLLQSGLPGLENLDAAALRLWSYRVRFEIPTLDMNQLPNDENKPRIRSHAQKIVGHILAVFGRLMENVNLIDERDLPDGDMISSISAAAFVDAILGSP
ncbi:hypothetical protein HDV00_005883 [Rhizophlyctis rosea]|nr:hypothetical protein HDV00_005883 [Rhizophlyctis rosea]